MTRHSGRSGTAVDSALKTFRRRKILTLMEVAGLIRRTIHTARRWLKAQMVRRCYNKNGRYYTLPDVPEFDANGLWRWRAILFSRYGNLTETVIELIRRSEAGLDATEVGERIGLAPRSFLSAFAGHPGLRREKTQGRFIYYAADPSLYSQQRQRRSLMSATRRDPSELEAMAILVEKIKHPVLSVEELCRRLRRKKLQVEPEMILSLFARHGLGVKKTPHLG
ncbi:MAG: hypothetical protein MUO24_10665 [Desulfobacterales bacterium]|nr:hypothetical protein [Desulfobacterales bacterium]